MSYRVTPYRYQFQCSESISQIYFNTYITLKLLWLVLVMFTTELRLVLLLFAGCGNAASQILTPISMIFSACDSMTPIYYNNYVRLQLLWLICGFSLTAITIKNIVIWCWESKIQSYPLINVDVNVDPGSTRFLMIYLYKTRALVEGVDV